MTIQSANLGNLNVYRISEGTASITAPLTVSNITTPQFLVDSPTGHANIHINASGSQASVIRFTDGGSRTWGFLSNYPSDEHFTLYNYTTGKRTIEITEADEFLLDQTYDQTTANAANVYIASSGHLQHSTSDQRMKHTITPITGALNLVTQLNGRYFYDLSDTGSESRLAGFVAQEVEPIIPELIPEKKYHSLHTGSMKGVSYGTVTAFLVEAIKEQQTTIATLTTRIATLENA